MASLKTTLMKGTGATNVLGRTTEEDLQKLAKTTGQPVPPTDPGGATQIGATPKQADMAGSSANLKSTLQLAASGGEAPTSLRDTLRQEQARKQLTAAEQQQKELQAKMQTGAAQLTAEAAGAAVQGAFTGLTPEEAKLKLSSDYTWLEENADEKQKDAVARLMISESSQGITSSDWNDILKIKGQDGKPLVTFEDFTKDKSEAVDKVKSIFGDENAQVSQAAAEKVIDFDDFGLEEIYVDENGEVDTEAINELSQSLGLTPEDLSKMNMNQIQEKMNEVVEEEYSKTADLFEQASDENLSPAERAEARKLAKDMGATGIASMELTDVDKLSDTVAESDTIMVGDKEMLVEDVLNDEQISGLVSNYLEEGEDGPASKELEAMGDLKKFVDDHKGAFSKLVSQVDSSVKNYADIQSHNYNQANSLKNYISSDAVQAFLDDPDNQAFTSLSDSKKNIPLLERHDIAGGLKHLKNTDLQISFALADNLPEDIPEGGMTKFIESSNFNEDMKLYSGPTPRTGANDLLGMNDQDISKFEDALSLAKIGILPIDSGANKAMGILFKDGKFNQDWKAKAMDMTSQGIGDLGRGGRNLTRKDFEVLKNPSTFISGVGRDILEAGGITKEGQINSQGVEKMPDDVLEKYATEKPSAFVNFEEVKQRFKPSSDSQVNTWLSEATGGEVPDMASMDSWTSTEALEGEIQSYGQGGLAPPGALSAGKHRLSKAKAAYRKLSEFVPGMSPLRKKFAEEYKSRLNSAIKNLHASILTHEYEYDRHRDKVLKEGGYG